MAFHFRKPFHATVGSYSRLDPWLTLALLLLPLAISLPLVAGDFVSARSAESVLEIATLGIGPAPGHPLYLLAARLASRLVFFASWLWAAHAASLLFTIAAAILFYWSGRKLHFPPLVCFSAGLLLAFSPLLWQASLTAGPMAWHLLMVSALMFLSVDLLMLQTWKFPRLQWVLWSAACGAVAGQQASLAVWGGVAWVFGMILSRPRVPEKQANLALLLLAAVAAFVLPYLYLLMRVADPHAYAHPDALFQYAGQSRALLAQWLTWLVWYLAGGYRSLEPAAASAAWGLGESLLIFFKTYPFMGSVIGLFGGGLFLQQISLQPAERKNQIAYYSRLKVLGLLATGAVLTLLLCPRQPDAQHLALTLIMAWWSLAALEYVFLQLGQADSETAKAGAKPAWFGILVTLLVPGLAILHGYPPARAGSRPANAPGSLYREARAFLRDLPPKTVVIFGRTEASYPFVYLQKLKGLRKDLVLATPSRIWPWKIWTGPLTPVFRGRETLAWHRQLFHDYWKEGLNAHLAAGRPTVLLLPPGAPQAALVDLLETYALADVGLRWPAAQGWEADSLLKLWQQPARLQPRPVYRLRARPLRSRLEPAAAAGKTVLATLEGRLRLLVAKEPFGGLALVPGELLQLPLFWQVLKKTERPLTVRMRLMPEGASQAVPAWEDARRLGPGGMLTGLNPLDHFQEIYQLPLPSNLANGRYRFEVGVRDEEGRWLAAGTTAEPENYFVPICEVVVLAPASPSKSGP